MTTITYRDGIMAADSRAFSGDRHPIGFKKKVHRLSNGALFGASSTKVGECERFRALVNEHGVEAEYADDLPVSAIVVLPDETIWFFYKGRCFSGPIKADFAAIGSGEEYAYAALVKGASARGAIKVAIQCDVWTDGPIRHLRLHNKGKT